MQDLRNFSSTALDEMAAAAREVTECERVLRNSDDNVVGELLRGQGTFYEWTHYPQGDVYDSETHAQYYYHAHSKGDRGREHGHFHTFLRPKGMPKAVRPAPLPNVEPPAGDNDALSHLIGISMDAAGAPLALFTTNRWVTGETWYSADDVCAMLDRFVIDHARPSWPVNRWITAMVRLFRPQIVDLLHQRDAAVAAWSVAPAEGDVYEDRRLEVTSEKTISVAAQVRRIKAAIAAG